MNRPDFVCFKTDPDGKQWIQDNETKLKTELIAYPHDVNGYK